MILYVKGECDYLRRFEGLARDWKGPLVTFEEDARMESTAQRYRRIDRQRGDTYFIKTVPCGSQPIEMVERREVEIAWSDVVDFLKAFGAKSINLVGGEYNERGPGCLNCIYFALSDAGLPVEVLKEATFS